jgi:starch phosphorylase
MKVVPNGGLNVSVLDGWWAEAYRPGVGWAIGDGQEFVHPGYQDEVDAEALYALLEREIVPLFYDRDADGVPRGWIAMMKNSIRTLAPVFCGDRMIQQYVERFYLPASEHYQRVAANDYALARELAAWKSHIREAWDDVRVGRVEELGPSNISVGEGIEVEARVDLAGLDPGEVAVQAYYSRLRSDGSLTNGHGIDLRLTGRDGDEYVYGGTVPSRASGLHGFAVRVLPFHEDVLVPHELPLIAWEETEE